MDLRDRASLLIKAHNNKELQAVLMEKCRRDPVFWFNTFAYTFDPRKPNAQLPFNLYPFQEWFVRDIVDAIEQQEDIGVEKSRAMGASWMFMGIFLWAWIYRPGWDIHVGSRREAEVDTVTADPSTLFGKIRFMMQRLPSWMKPQPGDIELKKLLLRNNRNGNVITGESSNRDFGRGPRKRAVFLDEFASWENADYVYDGLAATTNCRIVNSTPCGESNKYARLMHNPENDYRPYPEEEQCLIDKGLKDVA